MVASDRSSPDIFTIRDVARAAGVRTDEVRTLVRAGEVASVGDRYLGFDAATHLVRLLNGSAQTAADGRRLFTPARATADRHGVPLLASGGLHAVLIGALLLVGSLGAAARPAAQLVRDTPRMIFLSLPGPGGGGGGGGLRQAAPAPRAELKSAKPMRSPVALSRKRDSPEPEAPRPAPPPPASAKPEPELPPAAAPLPPVTAPVVAAADDTRDRAGVLDASAEESTNGGSGEGGGAGTGRGTGNGEGSGAGIGSGSIAGVGGGPYKPGSGVTPPTLVREVKPIYTEEGRRAGIEGDVILDVVVRADGRVGAVTVTRSLGGGLEQRAVEAVRQWTFLPSRRNGAPVDVLVEVAVEFRLR